MSVHTLSENIFETLDNKVFYRASDGRAWELPRNIDGLYREMAALKKVADKARIALVVSSTSNMLAIKEALEELEIEE